MDQIRFDFLATQVATALSRSAGTAATTADSTDAFSQVLDQELADPKDRTGATPSNTDTTQRNSDTNGYGGQPNQGWRTTRRRDGAQNQTSAVKPKQNAGSQTTAKTTVRTKPTSTVAAAAKPATDTQAASTDQTPTNTPVTAVKPDSTTDTLLTAPDAKSDPDAEVGKGSQSQTQTDDTGNTAAPQTQTVAISASVTSTATVVVPALLPLQIVATKPSDGSDLLSGKGGNAAALSLLQGSLLAQQQMDLSALTATPQTGTATGKDALSFGAVIAAEAQAQLPGGTPASVADKNTGGDASATTTGADPFDPQDPTAQNPAGQIAAAANPRGLTTAGRSATAAKPKNGDITATSAVPATTPNEVRGASAVQPVSPGFSPAWTGTGESGGDSYEDSSAGYGSGAAAADADFSTLSQYLGANAAEGLASGLSARQSAFIAQLKQNLQILPPQEQIAVQIQNAMQKGTTRLTVNLHPAELGRVEVKLNVDKDKNVTAQVTVDRPATLDLLQRDAHTLERALQDAGLQTSSGSLSFNLRDTGGQGGGAPQNGGGGQSGAGSGPATADATKAAPADVVATGDGYVDLKT